MIAVRRQTFVVLVASPVLAGCGLDGSGCTAVGGINGIGVEIAQQLWVAEGDVEVTACEDDGCASATKHMARLTKRQGGGRPEVRSQLATFDDLGHLFDDGTVDVTVELRDDADRLVAHRETEIELTRHWPNGNDCDGGGYVSGLLDLRPEDAVAAPA